MVAIISECDLKKINISFGSTRSFEHCTTMKHKRSGFSQNALYARPKYEYTYLRNKKLDNIVKHVLKTTLILNSRSDKNLSKKSENQF